jgi:hypothetical protein
MTIQINKVTRNSYERLGNSYTQVELESGKHSVVVVVCRGNQNYIGVVVQNAANRAWRGMGKEFATEQDAVNNYKTPAIKAMIAEACKMAA